MSEAIERLKEAASYAEMEQPTIFIEVREIGIQLRMNGLKVLVDWGQFEKAKINILVMQIKYMRGHAEFFKHRQSA